MLAAAFTRSRREPPNLQAGRRAAAGAFIAASLVAGSASGQVQVQPLAPPDLFSVGSGAPDLPTDLWRGSSAALARAVIPQIGQKPLSPAAVALARRLLSAGGNAPEGAGDDVELAAARAGALLRLGDAGAAQTIAERTPNLAQKPALSQVAAEAALIRGQEDKACAFGDALTAGRDGIFWLRLRAFCQARAGNAAATCDRAGFCARLGVRSAMVWAAPASPRRSRAPARAATASSGLGCAPFARPGRETRPPPSSPST